MSARDRSMTSRGGAGSERGDDESDGGVEERQHHTLTLSQGRALRRELSRHTLFGGGELAVESSPDTTLGTSEAEELARAFAIAANVGGGGGGGGGARRGRASADGGRPMVTFDTVPEIIVESPARAVEIERGGSPNASDAMAAGGHGNVKSTTLTAASGRELAAELKKVQMQHSSSSAAPATRDATFSTTGSENVLEGKEEKTRRAIKTLQRQTDALMFLADAVEAKELPGLAARMRERLMSMKENYHDLMSYEGIRQRKKGAMKNARKYDLLRATFGHDDQNKQTMPTHGADKPIEQRRKLKILAAKMLFAGVVFLVLLMIPFLVTQYEAQDQHVGCDSTTPGLVKLDHASKGQLELNVLVGPCSYDDADYTLAYSVVQGDSAEYVLATTSGVSLPHESTSSSAHRRRKLLGGGGGGVSSHLKSSFSSFTLSDYDASHGDAYVKFTTDCPEPVAISMLAYDTGMVGTVGTWLGLVLLIVVFGLIITEIIHRTLVAFIGAAAVLFILALQHRLPTVADILTWMDHGTLALLFGMMIIVALLSRTGVFEFLSVRIVQAANGSMWRLFIMLMIFDAVLSAFLDNVTTMLLLAPVALSLCKALKIDPRPLLIPLSIFGNIGGCSTLIGDPPNIIIGNALKEYIGFVDFLRVLGPGVLLTMPFIFMFVKWYYGEALFGQKIKVDIDELKLKYPIRDWDLLIRSGTILGFVIVLFFLHPVMHMEPAYVAVFGAIAILLSGSHDEFEYALEKVEWDSLLFFAGLFVFTEGIAKLGLLREIADMLSTLIASFPIAKRQVGAMLLVQLVAGVASAFVDNIPFTTTMLPVIIQMADQVEGLSIEALAWALCFGADYGGIGTLIGSSANIVMAGISAEAGFPITFNSFFRIGWPVMCISLCISGAYLAALEAGGVFKV